MRNDDALPHPQMFDALAHLGYVARVCSEIGRELRSAAGRIAIVLRSTVLPGTAEDVAIPALESASGKRLGADFGFALNPEFLRGKTLPVPGWMDGTISIPVPFEEVA